MGGQTCANRFTNERITPCQEWVTSASPAWRGRHLRRGSRFVQSLAKPRITIGVRRRPKCRALASRGTKWSRFQIGPEPFTTALTHSISLSQASQMCCRAQNNSRISPIHRCYSSIIWLLKAEWNSNSRDNLFSRWTKRPTTWSGGSILRSLPPAAKEVWHRWTRPAKFIQKLSSQLTLEMCQ